MYRKDLRPDIVASFLGEFNAFGPKLTLDQIASKIHISKKTIYRFFEGKDDIYLYICKIASKKLQTALEEIEKGEGTTVEKMAKMIRARSCWAKDIDVSYVRELKEVSPDVYAAFLHLHHIHWESMMVLMNQGKNEGMVKSALDLRLAIRYLEAGLDALLDDDILATTGLTYAQAVDSLSDTFLNGMLNR